MGPTNRSRSPDQLSAVNIVAAHGVGVQDLRPLRGRASGPILDPDTALPHAHSPAKKIKIVVSTYLLTSPAPSGMTCAVDCCSRWPSAAA